MLAVRIASTAYPAHEIATLGLRMTVRFGSMLFVGLGLTIAAMRLWT
jgi:hypothetical protein